MGFHQSHDPDRRCLRLEEWPEPDRAAWDAILAEGDLLDDGGAGAHWSAASRHKYLGGYSRWLGFLQRGGWLDPLTRPAERVTRERVSTYVAALRDTVADYTLIGRLAELRAVISAMAPDRDWAWLTSPATAIRRRGVITRPKTDLRLSRELQQAGRDMMAEAIDLSGSMRQAVCYRNGLMFALLASRSIRLRNLAMMTIDRHLVRTGDTFVLVFSDSETKAGNHLEWPLSMALTEAIDKYLTVFRPVLLKGNRSSALWINLNGRPLGSEGIERQFRLITKARFGTEFGPHRFRDAAATSVALYDPSHVGIIAPLLGNTARTSEHYYNQASSVEAAASVQANIRHLRRRHGAGVRGRRARRHETLDSNDVSTSSSDER